MLTRQASTPRGGKGTINTGSLVLDRKLTVPAKLEDVAQILGELKADLTAKKLPAKGMRTAILTIYRTAHILLGRKHLLEALKVHGRTMENSDPIFTKDVCCIRTIL
jgi:hypothetical protein